MLYQKKYHNIGFCANNRPKSVDNIAARVLTCNSVGLSICMTTSIMSLSYSYYSDNMFRPIVYLKSNVVIFFLVEHCFLMLSAVTLIDVKFTSINLFRQYSNYGFKINDIDLLE